MLPVFEIFFSINRSISTRSGPPVTFKFLPNAVSLSRFIFCLNCKVCWFRDIKICKWCLILPARTRCIAIIIIFVLNQLNGFTINKSKVIYFIFSVYFLFLVALNKYKNKIWETIFQSSMKTLFFFFFEEILKNDLFYLEEKQGMSYACVPNEHIQGPILWWRFQRYWRWPSYKPQHGGKTFKKDKKTFTENENIFHGGGTDHKRYML